MKQEQSKKRLPQRQKPQTAEKQAKRFAICSWTKNKCSNSTLTILAVEFCHFHQSDKNFTS